MWNDAVELFVTYMGSGIIVGWFIISLLYLFIKERDSSKRILFLYFPILILLLYFNPLFVNVVYGIIGEEVYYRFLWIVPMTITIAYTVTCIYASLQRAARGIFVGCCIVLIAVSGRWIYSNEYFSVAENVYHIPETVVKICDTIAVEGREVTAAFPREMVQYVRQYDSTICMPYGREVLVSRWGNGHPILDMISSGEINVDEFVFWTKDKEYGSDRPCNFIIVPEEIEFIGDLEAYGIVLYDTIDGYDIYHDTTFYIGL
ncbi:MAG: hypothetical protein IJ324_09305 [Lachnospiraceae bacterium]|nr:hypothetical protein [Lachnospiraceae bacterium]